MSLYRLLAPLIVLIVALSTVAATAAPFDVYFRPSEKANWIFYGGRETRGGADAAAAELAKTSGFQTKVFALGEPVGRPAIGANVAESIAVGGTSYVRRSGLGYAPGWHRYGGWGGGWSSGWGGWGSGWGGGYGGYGRSSSDHSHSSHHHSHSGRSSHHGAHHATAHPSRGAAHSGARGRSAAHHSAAHHSHAHSHSHGHGHSHGGHRK
jgi:hypothetical protein